MMQVGRKRDVIIKKLLPIPDVLVKNIDWVLVDLVIVTGIEFIFDKRGTL